MSRTDRKRGSVVTHLSLAEAAERMGISERTARRWIKSGKLRASKPGRDYWIPESAITELVEESEVSPKAERRSSREPSLFNGEEAGDERLEKPIDLALHAAERQAIADRQAIARAYSSEQPDSGMVRYENEALMSLLKYPHGDVAEALVDLARRHVLLEQENARLREAAREWQAEKA
jgi:excisionase family DNA binding protein